MSFLGYEMRTTGGSGRKFIHPSSGTVLFMHQPHPSNILKAYQVREVIKHLRKEGRLP
jgi:predicted RNA binding protein YcfA (HicA-like mRNA interferase family)